MTTTPQEDFAHLVHLTKEYLLKQFSTGERLFCDKETYNYYKDYALAKRRQDKKEAIPPELIKNEQKQTVPRKLPTLSPPVISSPSVSKPIQPAKPPIEKKVEKAPKTSFSLQPLDSVSAPNFQEYRKLMAANFPNVQILDELPVSKEPKVKKPVAYQVLLLALDETVEQKEFLKNMANALCEKKCQAVVVPARKLQQDGRWKEVLSFRSLQLVIASAQVMRTMKGLHEFYRASSDGSMHYLGGVTLFILDDVQKYMQNVQLKRDLWKAMRTHLNI